MAKTTMTGTTSGQTATIHAEPEEITYFAMEIYDDWYDAESDRYDITIRDPHYRLITLRFTERQIQQIHQFLMLEKAQQKYYKLRR